MSNTKLLRDIIQWDVRTWSRALQLWESKVEWSRTHHALELGAREGGLSLWLALKGTSVVCSDLKDVAATALPLHTQHGEKVTALITYADVDVSQMPFENQFDIVVFKSIMGGVGYDQNFERQQKAFDCIYRALKPGGYLLFAENLTGSAFHQQLRRKYVRWGASWRYLNVDEMKSFLTRYSYSEAHCTGFLAVLGRSEAQRSFLAVMDQLFFNWWLPDRKKYMIYGLARK
jgi:SAM-dependent methyltransferase